MDDIVDKLRGDFPAEYVKEAVDEIESLRKERDSALQTCETQDSEIKDLRGRIERGTEMDDEGFSAEAMGVKYDWDNGRYVMPWEQP